MHYQFLIEDQSSTALIEIIMPKIIINNKDVTFNCKSFKGLGGLKKKNTAKDIKTGKLLNDLAIYLRGFDKSLKYNPSVIVTVLDNDKRNTQAFQRELENIAIQNHISIDYVFCIAVEEVEAWLLGDKQAIIAAYPKAKVQIINAYKQDSICGTWEVLADAIYPGGLTEFKKDCPTFIEIGKFKKLWAESIGGKMDISNNKSPSFNLFLQEINKRLP